MESNQSYVDNLARYRANLYPVANSNSIFADEEEIADDRYDYVLQSNSDASSDQPSECSDGSQFSNECEQEHNADATPEDNLPHQHELITASRVMNVAEDCASPELANKEDRSQRDQ